MADARQTPASKKAWGIYAEIADIDPPFTKTYGVEEDPERVAKVLRALIGASSTTGISVLIEGNCITVGTRRKNSPLRREEILEEMVRKLAMKVDDDKLYEEALALVRYI